MKIVVMLSSYYPYYSAIGKCMRNLILEFEKKHEVIVISNMNTLGLLSEEDFGNHKIIRIRTPNLQKRDLLANGLHSKNNMIKRLSIKLRIFFLRVIGAIRIIFSKVSLQQDLCDEYLDVLSHINEVDLIIPTCYPFEAIVAAQRYVRSTQYPVKLLPILFDKFSESPTLHRLKINQRIKYQNHLDLEGKMIQDAASVFFVDSWKEHLNEYFPDYSGKFHYIEHPLIVEINQAESTSDPIDQNIDIVYAGVLDKTVRPPRKTLEVISELINLDSDIRFHFYAIGNCGALLRKYQNLYPFNVYDHGYLESEIVLETMSQSNLLLSIGNTDISLIPSKIFEYMSLGKPIIHFYKDTQDPLIDMLKAYELAICVDQNKIIESKGLFDILAFIRENKKKVKEFGEVEEMFKTATPEYVADLIMRNSKT